MAQNTLKNAYFKKQAVILVKAFQELFSKGSNFGKFKKYLKNHRNEPYFIWYFQLSNMSKSENQKNILCGSVF